MELGKLGIISIQRNIMVVAAYLCRMFHKNLSEVQRVKKGDLDPKDEPRVGLTSESTAKKEITLCKGYTIIFTEK